MKTTSNKCPHPKCDNLKPREQYACKRHWFGLPKAVQRAIWSGYRNGASAWVAADKQAMEYWKAEESPQGQMPDAGPT